MTSSAFVTGLPTSVRTSRRRRDGPSGRHNRSSVRATASQPPAPRDDRSDDDSLAKSRAAFEKMYGLDLTSEGGKSGHCACIWCSGTKERRCSWCGGKGYREELPQKSWEQLSMDIEKMNEGDNQHFMELPKKVPVQCSACSGSKKLRCAYCRGSGIGSYGHSH